MPRLSKELVFKRETLAKDLFTRGYSIDEVQKELVINFNGVKMAPPRLKELYDEVNSKNPNLVVAKTVANAITDNFVKELEQDLKVDIPVKVENKRKPNYSGIDWDDPKTIEIGQKQKKILKETGRLVIFDNP